MDRPPTSPHGPCICKRYPKEPWLPKSAFCLAAVIILPALSAIPAILLAAITGIEPATFCLGITLILWVVGIFQISSYYGKIRHRSWFPPVVGVVGLFLLVLGMSLIAATLGANEAGLLGQIFGACLGAAGGLFALSSSLHQISLQI